MPPQSQVFRPRLPLDPFTSWDIPWLIPHFSIHHPNPHVILLLGAPSSTDIVPLATSPHLSNALLILATHTPPPIPINPACAIIILHLPAPLAVHDNGALRLVSLLERAQRVAHAWLATRHPPRILQLAEQQPGGQFTRNEPIELAQSSLAISNPRIQFSVTSKKHVKQAPLFTALVNFLPPTLQDKALLKHAVLVTTLSANFLTPPSPLSTSPYDNPDTKHRRRSLFHAPSKSTPNLTVPSASSKRSRLSVFFTSSTSTTPFTSAAPSVESLSPKAKQKQKYQDPCPPNDKPHIIHVLPYSSFFPSRPASAGAAVPHTSSLHPNRRASAVGPARPYPNQRPRKTKLVQSIEQFLLSHAYPLSMPPHPANPTPAGSRPTSMCSTYSMSGVGAVPIALNGATDPMAKPVVPFVVPPGVLGSVPRCSQGMSVGEMVVLGALDGVAAGEPGAQAREGEGEGRWPRAWIGDGGDVVVGERQVRKPRGARVNEMGLLTPPDSLEGEAGVSVSASLSPSVSASPSGSSEGEGEAPLSSWPRSRQQDERAAPSSRVRDHGEMAMGVAGKYSTSKGGWTVDESVVVEKSLRDLKIRVASFFRRGFGGGVPSSKGYS